MTLSRIVHLSRIVQRAAFAAAISAVTAGASEQGQPAGTGGREIDRVFRQLYENPADPELTLRYARLAMEEGNSEAAVGALERLVLFNDNLPRARIELGVLYYRLGSYAQARDYLKRGLADPNLPADARTNGERYLEEVEKALSPHKLSGGLTVGFRYQTNANLAPSSRTVLSNGNSLRLSNRFRRQDDGNFFGFANVQHDYDFGLDRELNLETNAQLYGAKQFSRGDLDLAILDVTSGPRIQLFPDAAPGLSLRPFVRGSYSNLDTDTYFGAMGGGLNLRHEYSERLRVEMEWEGRYLDYNSTQRRPFADELSGFENSATLRTRYNLTPSQAIEGRIGGRFMNAEESYESFDEVSIGLGYQIGYRNPFFANLPQWQASVYGSYSHGWYHSPDPSVRPGRTREEDEFRIGGYHVFALSKSWSVLTLIEYLENDANIRNYDYNDLSVMLGVTWSF